MQFYVETFCLAINKASDTFIRGIVIIQKFIFKFQKKERLKEILFFFLLIPNSDI